MVKEDNTEQIIIKVTPRFKEEFEYIAEILGVQPEEIIKTETALKIHTLKMDMQDNHIVPYRMPKEEKS